MLCFLSTVILAACSITFTLIFSRRFVRIIDEGTKELQVMMEKFRESEEHFRLLTETASDAIIGMEAPGIVNFWNKKAEEMFGYPASEAMGKDMHSLIVPERYREKAIQGLRLFFQTGTGHIVGKTVGLFALRRGDAEFPVELSVSAMKMRGKMAGGGYYQGHYRTQEDGGKSETAAGRSGAVQEGYHKEGDSDEGIEGQDGGIGAGG